MSESDTSVLVVPLWIDGKEVLASSTYDVTSPKTNEVCWKAASANKENALKAVEAAESAFPSWSNTKPNFRRDILLRAADFLEARGEGYGGFVQTEMGANASVASGFILALGIKMMRDIASRISSICGSVPVCEDEGTSAIVYKEPYGVTLGIVPW